MITTVYRARTTTSHISEASLAWETTPKQPNSSEIGKGTKVRHDNQDPRTAILPAPYSVPPILCARIFPSLVGQTRAWHARLNFSTFGFTGGRLLLQEDRGGVWWPRRSFKRITDLVFCERIALYSSAVHCIVRSVPWNSEAFRSVPVRSGPWNSEASCAACTKCGPSLDRQGFTLRPYDVITKALGHMAMGKEWSQFLAEFLRSTHYQQWRCSSDLKVIVHSSLCCKLWLVSYLA